MSFPLCKSISHCHCVCLVGKTQVSFYQLTSVAYTLHQRSKNMPNGWTDLEEGEGTDQTAPEYEQSDQSLHCFVNLFRHI